MVNGRGPLEFTLEWFSVSGRQTPTNVDLIVTDPTGQVLSALNPVVGTGVETGQHFGDDPGDPGLGGERAAWGEFFPAGTFTVRAVHQGGDDAQVIVTAFQGEGSELVTTPLTGDPQAPPVVLKPGETFTATLSPPAAPPSPKVAATERRAARRAEQDQRRQAATAAKAARAPSAGRAGKR